MARRISRRDVLKSSAALGITTLFASPLKAAAPPPAEVTPALLAAARKEGKATFYTALELATSERLARSFEAKYPGVAIRVERSGAERVYQRIGQEQSSRVYAVDVVCSTDPSHFLDWTGAGKDWVEPFVTEDMAKHFPKDQVDPNGMHGQLVRLARSDRLQHQSGEARGRAEKLRRSARSEMAGQDLQGPSRLQRRDPDQHLSVGARAGLAVSRKAGQAEGDAAAIGRRSAEENRRSASAR